MQSTRNPKDVRELPKSRGVSEFPYELKNKEERRLESNQGLEKLVAARNIRRSTKNGAMEDFNRKLIESARENENFERRLDVATRQTENMRIGKPSGSMEAFKRGLLDRARVTSSGMGDGKSMNDYARNLFSDGPVPSSDDASRRALIKSNRVLTKNAGFEDQYVPRNQSRVLRSTPLPVDRVGRSFIQMGTMESDKLVGGPDCLLRNSAGEQTRLLESHGGMNANTFTCPKNGDNFVRLLSKTGVPTAEITQERCRQMQDHAMRGCASAGIEHFCGPCAAASRNA